MEQLSLIDDGLKRCVERSKEVLEAGGVILYPADTVYELGVDSCNEAAVQKVIRIKQPSEAKHMLSIVADMDMAERLAVVNETARELARKYLPGPLSLVLPKQIDCPSQPSTVVGIGDDGALTIYRQGIVVI
jgi:L-threonylcarbamoyladenylate synthase